jgi:hypothetical protein
MRATLRFKASTRRWSSHLFSRSNILCSLNRIYGLYLNAAPFSLFGRQAYKWSHPGRTHVCNFLQLFQAKLSMARRSRRFYVNPAGLPSVTSGSSKTGRRFKLMHHAAIDEQVLVPITASDAQTFNRIPV